MNDMARLPLRGFNLSIIMLIASLVGGCESWNRIGEPASARPATARYPVDPDIAKQTKNPYRTLKDSRGVLLGDLKAGTSLPAWFDGKSAPDARIAEPRQGGDGVNRFLWRASLDTVAFMPVKVADVQGGVIQTDWYQDRERPDERFRVNVFVIGDRLSVEGVRVGVFRQERVGKGDGWSQAEVSPQIAEDLRTIIVDRAEDLRGDDRG